MSFSPTVLAIDDEERILRSLAMLFRGAAYDFHMTTDPQQALNLIASQRVHVIISDQRMPIMRGADLLKLVKEKSPNTMRLLLTGYSELDAVVASVNEGEIFRFINKPWDANELRETVKQASEISYSLFNVGPVAPPRSLQTENAIFVAPGKPPQPESILVIDDDADVVKVVQDIVGPAQPVIWAQSLDAAMAALEKHQVGVIISELTVGHESIITFLKLLKAQHPEVVTIALTPFRDVMVFIGLINQAQVFRLLPKPVRRGPLSMNIGSALRHHRMLRDSTSLRAVHGVEAIRQPEEISSSVAIRVRGFLDRLRGRSLGTVTN